MIKPRCKIFLFLLILSVVVSSCKSTEECQDFTAEDAIWLLGEGAPDFEHLGIPALSSPFLLTGTDLAELFRLNNFNIAQGQKEVLFGLRGCKIIEGDGIFSPSVQLQEVSPDYINYRDVIGVFDQSTNEVAVFSGSTVPNWDYMCWQAEEGGHNANMLPTGMYPLEVGYHREIEGAFRQDDEIIVLRSNDDLIYETTDLWEVWVPYDNIHPGGCPGDAFSSGGCQTIEGTFGDKCDAYPSASKEQHNGEWGAFRAAAGLDPDDNQDRWGETFFYILLTCREAGLLSTGQEGLERLRFGSQGNAVYSLQTALKQLGYDSVPQDSILGPETAYALIEWEQSQNDGAADGILTPAEAQLLGFTLSD